CRDRSGQRFCWEMRSGMIELIPKLIPKSRRTRRRKELPREPRMDTNELESRSIRGFKSAPILRDASALFKLFHGVLHFRQVGIGIHGIGNVQNLAIGSDEKTDTARHFLSGHTHPIPIRNFSISIRQERKIQVVLGDELLMAVR